MPWTTILQDENGQAIETCLDFLDNNEFNQIELSQFKLFKYMLPYSDTTFNEAQIPDLIVDFEILKKTSKQKNIINKIIELAKKCPQTSHSYLKFYGD